MIVWQDNHKYSIWEIISTLSHYRTANISFYITVNQSVLCYYCWFWIRMQLKFLHISDSGAVLAVKQLAWISLKKKKMFSNAEVQDDISLKVSKMWRGEQLMRSNKIILTGRRIRNSKDLAGRGLSRGPSSSDWKNVCQSVVNSCRQEHWITKTRPRYNVFQPLLLMSHFTTALVVVKGFLLKKKHLVPMTPHNSQCWAENLCEIN